jgi:hypothetical protein
MSNQAKEGFWVIALTLCHAAITICNLGRIPIILFYNMQTTDVISLILWTVYAMILYLITIIFEAEKLKPNDFLKAFIFGILLSLGIGLVETIVDRILNLCIKADFVVLAINCQIEVLLIGFFLLYYLKLQRQKKKPVFDTKRLKTPLFFISIVLAFYIIMVSREIINYGQAVKISQASVKTKYNLDLYYTYRILDHNTWSYVVLYFLFWWFIQRLCISEKTT